jgi:hypothetical protein
MIVRTHQHRQLNEPLSEMLLEDEAPRYDATEAQREELPHYEPAPSYNREIHEVPLHTYYLRAPNRKSLMVVPYGPSSSGSFKVTSRSSRPFSKKPRMEVWRSIRASVPTDDEYVAGIWLDTEGPLPWCPRARFVRQNPTEGNQTYKMEARNFSDWKVSVNGSLYTWSLEVEPFSLVLCQDGMQDTVARFNFSILGLVATGGAAVGDLTIFRDGLSQDRAGVEVILCALVTALTQFKRMGRRYKNEASAVPERVQLPEERSAMDRTVARQFLTRREGSWGASCV